MGKLDGRVGPRILLRAADDATPVPTQTLSATVPTRQNETISPTVPTERFSMGRVYWFALVHQSTSG